MASNVVIVDHRRKSASSTRSSLESTPLESALAGLSLNAKASATNTPLHNNGRSSPSPSNSSSERSDEHTPYAKRGSCTLQGHGIFKTQSKTWSSNCAKVTFALRKNAVKAVRHWGQAAIGQPKKWVKPLFPRKEWKRLLQRAYEILTTPREKVDRGVQEVKGEKPHLMKLCELCDTLGFSCQNLIEDAMGVVLRPSRDTMQARQERLNNGEVKVLYHQTSEESAQSILDSQVMLCGEKGLAGGGIYFAQSAADTDALALNKGVVLQAKVRLGRVKTLTPGEEKNRDICLESMLEEGYDSVLLPDPRGDMVVVYTASQVEGIELAPAHRGN